jgi:poly(3-hydroxybutyrate) depolymerase
MNLKRVLVVVGAVGATISVCFGQDGLRVTGSGGTSGTVAAGSAIPLRNPPVLSAGCGKATTVTTGKKTITSTGEERTYIIDLPTNYDMNEPYRLLYTSHWISGTSEGVRDMDYYSLKPLANADNEPAIFVAPQSDGATWQEKDHALFDDILDFVNNNLCIDTTRVFATGFSFGGMITYSLSVNHQDDIRAAVGIAPANYNIYVPPKTHEPIAWMQTTGMSDTLTPWINRDSTTQGSKFIAIERATDNGCTVPADIPTWQEGNHVCYDFEGCGASFPTKVCTFDGGHSPTATDPGSDTNWISEVSWAFIKQF